MASDIWNNSNMYEIGNIRANTSLYYLFFFHLQTIGSSFVTITKPLNNKNGESFCEGLKWMCKLFKKNGLKN